jgi:hypothetical protein
VRVQQQPHQRPAKPARISSGNGASKSGAMRSFPLEQAELDPPLRLDQL